MAEEAALTTIKNDVEIINSKTGEVCVVDEISKVFTDEKTFWKCYLADFLSVLGIFDSRQLDVFIHLVENTNPSNNLFISTQREIAYEVGCSLTTVNEIMKKLIEKGMIEKIQNGVYWVNPNVLMKGNVHKKQLLFTWKEDKQAVQNEMSILRSKRPAIPTTLELLEETNRHGSIEVGKDERQSSDN